MNDIRNITFEQFIKNSEVLVNQYARLLSPFFNADAIKCWKSMIYCLNMEEWKKDKIWETLNGDYEIEELQKFIN